MIEEAKSETQTGPEAPDIVKTIKSRVYLWLGLPGLVVLVVIGYAWTNWDSAKEWAGVSSRVQAQTSPKPEAVPASTATVSGGEFKPEQGAIDIGSTVHNYVVPPERLEKLSKELGVTQAALQSFFEIVEKKLVPARELDTTLRQIATSYNELLLKYEIITSDDPDVKALKEQARTALEARNFTQAEELLNQASDADVTAAGQMQAQANKRFVSAAESKAGNGAIQETQLNYPEAVAYYREAAELVESIRDAWEDWVSYLYRWGLLASRAGSYAEAQAAWEQALIIQEEKLGPEDPAVATSLNNLAGLYQTQGKYAEAVPPLERALAIWQAVHGPNHPDVAIDLNNLAELYQTQEKYAEAVPLLEQALAIDEAALGPAHSNVATKTKLNNLAVLYSTQGKYAEAEPLYQRALEIREAALGLEHPAVANSLYTLALLYQTQGQYGEAEPLYQRALGIMETVFGPNHPSTVTVRKSRQANLDLQNSQNAQNASEEKTGTE